MSSGAEVDEVARAIAIAGFGLSLTLAGVRVWEARFRRAKFEVDFRWNVGTHDEFLGVSFSIINVGYAKGSVLRVGFRSAETPEIELTSTQPIREKLPVVIEENAVSDRFDVVPEVSPEVAQRLRSGEFTIVTLEEPRKRFTSIALKEAPERIRES